MATHINTKASQGRSEASDCPIRALSCLHAPLSSYLPQGLDVVVIGVVVVVVVVVTAVPVVFGCFGELVVTFDSS